jgi:hypothetical protein
VLERGVENIQMWNNIRNNYRPEEHRAPEQIFDNQENIIQYWLENNDRVNEYLALQEERELRRRQHQDRVTG